MPTTSVKQPTRKTKEASIEDDLRELPRLMGRVVGRLKRGGPEVPEPFQEAFEDGGCGPRHLPALMSAYFEGPISVSQLAEFIGLSVATASLLIGELERAGLVERSEDEEDRRRTLVRVDPDVGRELDAWAKERLEPMRRTLERLSPEARANFMEGWRVLDEESARAIPGEPV
jgi:DNA-binding MarR family transcriptional regulator